MKALFSHLWFRILLGLGLGVAAGWALGPGGPGWVGAAQAAALIDWLALPGVLFLGLLQLIVVPLVICSIVTGLVDSGSLRTVRRLIFIILPYFAATTAVAIAIGMTLTALIQPGQYVEAGAALAAADAPQTFADLTVPQRIANLLPTNFAAAVLEKNMIQIVVAAFLAALALLALPADEGAPLLSLCRSVLALTMKVVDWAMALAPYAVFGLIAKAVFGTGLGALAGLAAYMGCVLGGLAAMLAVYLVLVGVIGGIGPLRFLAGIRNAQLIAFSTSSSAATIPVSLRAAEERLKLSPRVAGFAVPLGATINMDGTALYQAVAALFLAQVFGVDLSFGQALLLLLTTIGASVGTPGVPGVGIVVLATLLTGIGVPAEGIALILSVDRLLDMCRTTVNVTGDLTAAAVLNRLFTSPVSARDSVLPA